MKKVFLILMATLLVACSVDLQTPYGNIEPEGVIGGKNPCIVYEVNVPDVIWSIITIETVFIPVLVIFFDIMEPVGYVKDCKVPKTNVIRIR